MRFPDCYSEIGIFKIHFEILVGFYRINLLGDFKFTMGLNLSACFFLLQKKEQTKPDGPSVTSDIVCCDNNSRTSASQTADILADIMAKF
jgi:hypothetical protein